MDLYEEKNYENSKVKLNVTSELSSDSLDLSDQKSNERFTGCF